MSLLPILREDVFFVLRFELQPMQSFGQFDVVFEGQCVRTVYPKPDKLSEVIWNAFFYAPCCVYLCLPFFPRSLNLFFVRLVILYAQLVFLEALDFTRRKRIVRFRKNKARD